MNFEEFLISKKINIDSFKSNDSITFNKWQKLFSEVHPDSFVAQKKFLINPIRRKYPLTANS